MGEPQVQVIGQRVARVTQAAGRREELAGKIQERYGVAKDAAQKQVDEWVNSADDSWLKRQ